MSKNKTQWTMIYWDVDPATGKLAPYIRLVPGFMGLEAAGYSHGLSIGGFRKDKEEAEAFAASVDKFMETLVKEYQEECGPKQDEQKPILAVRVEDDCVEHHHPVYGGGYFFTEAAIVEMFEAPTTQVEQQ